MPLRWRHPEVTVVGARDDPSPVPDLVFGFEKNAILAFTGAAAITSTILAVQYCLYVHVIVPAVAAGDSGLPYLDGYGS